LKKKSLRLRLQRSTSINSHFEFYKEKEMADFRKLFYALALVALLAGLTVPVSAQSTSPFQCIANAGVPPTVRAEGFTELVGDITLNCTGGISTPAGQTVQPANITISITTDLTSRLLGTSGVWSEALLIVDEPHSAVNPGRPILNCGNAGAPDSGPSGPNVCAIVATTNPANTYDGTPNGYGAGSCGAGTAPATNAYSCGRPNVFQARLGTVQDPNQYNSVSWLGVPIDPPGSTTNRTFRFTNIRANAHLIGVTAPGNFFINQIQAQISINGNTSISVNNPLQTVAYVAVGLITSLGSNLGFLQCTTSNQYGLYPGGSVTLSSSATLPGVVIGFGAVTSYNGIGVSGDGPNPTFKFTEGFGSSWKAKNIAHILPSTNANAGNGTLVTAAAYWSYDGGTASGSSPVGGTINYPTDVNQNVPGAIYNTESGFEYPGASATLVKAPLADPANPGNPPYCLGTVPVTATTAALHNGTNIDDAGIANQGTRLQFTVSNIPAGAFPLVPEAIVLTNGTINSGIAVLVNTDAAGAGAYSPVAPAGTTAAAAVATYVPLPSTGMAVYEVLFADPFSIESASAAVIVTYAPNLSLNQPSPVTTAQAFGGFAPFYSTASAGYPQPLAGGAGVNLPVPRFAPGTVPANPNFFAIVKCSCDLLFPFVAATGGYDTGIAIANTSLDNLGFGGSSAATNQFGGVQFWYYGSLNGGAPPPTQCTNVASPGTCPTPSSTASTLVGQVPAGQILTYVLSSGGGQITSPTGGSGNGLDNRANGFTGYIIAQAAFQYCHAYAFITAIGAGPLSSAVSEGYLGLILANGSLIRPGLPPAEQLLH
jgi:hypothetical protein